MPMKMYHMKGSMNYYKQIGHTIYQKDDNSTIPDVKINKVNWKSYGAKTSEERASLNKNECSNSFKPVHPHSLQNH